MFSSAAGGSRQTTGLGRVATRSMRRLWIKATMRIIGTKCTKSSTTNDVVRNVAIRISNYQSNNIKNHPRWEIYIK